MKIPEGHNWRTDPRPSAAKMVEDAWDDYLAGLNVSELRVAVRTLKFTKLLDRARKIDAGEPSEYELLQEWEEFKKGAR